LQSQAGRESLWLEERSPRRGPPRPSVLEVASAVYSALSSRRPRARSAVVMVFEAGEAPVRVFEEVSVRDAGFGEALSSLLSSAERHGFVRSPYRHAWEEARVGDHAALAGVIEHVVEPLAREAGLDLGFRGSRVGYNWAYDEAALYLGEGRVVAKVFSPGPGRLYIVSETSSRNQPRTYYQLVALETSGERPSIAFACTCPWASGESVDRRGRPVSPEYSSTCKHLLALLYHTSPEVLAFLHSAAGRGERGELAERYRKALEEVDRRYREALRGLPEEAAAALRSNLIYFVVRRGVLSELAEKASAVKLVAPEHALKGLYSSIEVVRSARAEGHQYAVEVADAEALISFAREHGVYARLDRARDLLNRLQGSARDTLYTKALIAALILASNATKPPTILSVVGDPGTGKTITSTELAEMVGTRYLVVRAHIDPSEVAKGLASEAREVLEKYKRAAEEVAGSEAAEALEEMYRDLERVVSASGSPPAIPPGFVESYLSRVPGERRARAAMVLHTAASHLASLVAKAHDPSSVEAAARGVREEVLRVLERHGVIGSAAEKLEYNGGSVKWRVSRRDGGYEVAVYVATHYLLPLFSYGPERIRRLVEELSRLGEVYIAVEGGRAAVVKLSRAEDLEKMLLRRAVDPLGGRVIWERGDVGEATVVVVDEALLDPRLSQRLQTDLAEAAGSSRLTNLFVATSNIPPYVEAQRRPEMQAVFSRFAGEVVSSPASVRALVDSAVADLARARVSGELPLLTFDELLLLREAAEHAEVPDEFVAAAESLYYLFAYRVYVYRPEAFSPAQGAPIVVIAPRSSPAPAAELSGEYVEVSLAAEEELAEVRERRHSRFIVELAKALAVANGSARVGLEEVEAAVAIGSMPRIAPAGGDPYQFTSKKHAIAARLAKHVVDYITRDSKRLEPLLLYLASAQRPPPEAARQALEAMAENPVAAAVFLRFVQQMAASKKYREFLALAGGLPWLGKVVEQIAKYDHLDTSYTY